jgi:hypothetical protein
VGERENMPGDLPEESAIVGERSPETALLRGRFDEFNDL